MDKAKGIAEQSKEPTDPAVQCFALAIVLMSRLAPESRGQPLLLDGRVELPLAMRLAPSPRLYLAAIEVAIADAGLTRVAAIAAAVDGLKAECLRTHEAAREYGVAAQRSERGRLH